MSGIAGQFGVKDPQNIVSILNKIKHRGESTGKPWIGQNAAMGALNLPLLVEEPGPYVSPGREYAVVMDGHITNSAALTSSISGVADAPTPQALSVLNGFATHGIGIFERLEGEFALAIAGKNHMILARDNLGIKPLYYGFHQGNLFFASEIKALTECVDEVHEFPPGHYMLTDRGLYSYRPLLPDVVKLENPAESASILSDRLQEALQRSLPKNVGIGVWLSGGVDSSAIAALARPMVKQLHTFSIGVKDAPDLEYARQVAEHIGSTHHEHHYDLDEMLSVLDDVIYHLESYDAPLVRSAIANYIVAGQAADHVPFVLSGEGGDELFAGYAYQKECDEGTELTLSVQDAIADLHNTALQRVDRSATAHGTGVTMPFLDPHVVRYALAVPSCWKIQGDNAMEKWPLRKSVADLLPESVTWRGKAKFWEGAGAPETLAEYARDAVSDREFAEARRLHESYNLRSKEESLFFKIFHGHFGDKVPGSEIGRTLHI